MTERSGRMFRSLLLVFALFPLVALADVQLELRGGDDAQRENVEAYLRQLPLQDLTAEELTRRGRQQALRALQALGYYDAELSLQVSGSGEERRLRVALQPGQPVRVRRLQLDISGDAAADEAFDELRRRLPLAEGDVLHHGRYESIKRAVQNLALARGYFASRFTRTRVAVDTEQHTADIELGFDSGPRFRLGEVRFSDSPFNADLLNRLVPFESGEPYQADLVTQLNRRLLESQYFEAVTVRPEPEQAQDRRIPVVVELDADAKHLVNVGVGYSTDVGPRLRLRWRRPWINADGHKLGADLELAQRRQSITGTYDIPLEDPLVDSLQFQVGYQHEDIEDTESDRLTAAVTRQWERSNGWRQATYLRYEYDDFQSGLDENSTQFVLPGVSLTRLRMRGAPDPYWGDRQSYVLEATDRALCSSTDLVRTRIGTRWLRSVEGTHRLFLRLDLGALDAGDFTEVSPSLRFFAGGDQSIRGYAYQSVGPRDEAGNVVGGRYLLVAGAEYSYPVRPRWRLAVFADSGDAFNDWSQRDYRIGTGFGVHWASPVGPVRVDLAWAVSEDGNPFRLHVSLGSSL